MQQTIKLLEVFYCSRVFNLDGIFTLTSIRYVFQSSEANTGSLWEECSRMRYCWIIWCPRKHVFLIMRVESRAWLDACLPGLKLHPRIFIHLYILLMTILIYLSLPTYCLILRDPTIASVHWFPEHKCIFSLPFLWLYFTRKFVDLRPTLIYYYSLPVSLLQVYLFPNN